MKPKGKFPPTLEEQETITTLAAGGMSLNAIAKNVKRSRHLVRDVLQKPEIAGQVAVKREELACLFDQAAKKSLVSLTDKKYADASLVQALTAAGISVDKAALLRGQPTSIVGIEVLLDVAGQLRREERQADEEEERHWRETHTLPAITQHAPQPQIPPATRPTSQPQPSPQPAKNQEPTMRIKYSPVLPGKHEDHCPPESPLLHGLRLPGSRE
jgi:hypothetical protein